MVRDEVAVTLHGERVSGRFVFFKPDRDDQEEKDWLVQRRKADTPPGPGPERSPISFAS